ncbi:hypothetical protein Tco_1285199 [Tanacetum coccineum]
MADLIFADSHNMVAYLEKSEDNVDFAEVVDFLNASPIMYALTVSLTVYVSYIKQFWSTTKIKTINNETQIRAKVDGKTIVITKSSVRRDLHFNDEDGITCLTNTEIFENLQLIGSKSTAWNEFGTNIASAVICLAKKQKFNFSKLVFDVVEGEGSGQPTEPKHTPTTTLPSHVEPIPIVASSSQPKKIQKHRKIKIKATEISQSSRPTTLVADETVNEERGDSMERAAITVTSLDADSGGSLRRQDTIGDIPAQTRFERLSKHSYHSPLLRVNTPGSDRERIELKELMDMCTKLSDRVLDLENVKDAQALEIKRLKERVKKLEKKKKSRTPQLKRRLFKGRYGHDIGVNNASTSITTASINISTAEPVTTASAPVTTVGVSVSTAEPSTPPTTTTLIEDEDLIIAQTLMKMKSEKSKAKRVTMQEPTQRLQAELHEEVRLKREKEEEASKAATLLNGMIHDQESSKRQKTSKSSELAEELRVKEADELSQEELQQMMIIVPEQGMNVEALQTKYPIIDWEIYTEGTRNLVKEKFNSTKITDDKERKIWVKLKRLFEPDTDDELWKLQKHIHDLTWRLYDSCGVHHVSTEKGIDIYMLVEKEYPLSRGTLTLMLVAKLLVDQDNEMSRELLRKIFMQLQLLVGVTAAAQD